MSLSRPVLPLMATARPFAAPRLALAAHRALYRPTPLAFHSLTALQSPHPHNCLSLTSIEQRHTPTRTFHSRPRHQLSTSASSFPRRPSPASSSTSLSSLPPTALQLHRPFTQYVVLSLLVLSGYFVRRKYLEMRAMRPDMQSSPLDPSAASAVQWHEGGFGDRMDRTEAALILGVRDGASKERIMERYRQLMKVNHPDLGGSPYVSTKINEAKELLSKTARSEHEGGERRGGKRWQKV